MKKIVLVAIALSTISLTACDAEQVKQGVTDTIATAESVATDIHAQAENVATNAHSEIEDKLAKAVDVSTEANELVAFTAKSLADVTAQIKEQSIQTADTLETAKTSLSESESIDLLTNIAKADISNGDSTSKE